MNPSRDPKIKYSLRASFLDGVFASLMLGLITDYVAPFALALKATVREIGLLSSVPNFVSSLFHIKSPDLAERAGSRRKIVNTFIFLQVLTMLPMAFLPFIFKTHQVLSLIVLVTLFSAFGALTLGPWASMLSDHILPQDRGRYYGWRNKALGSIAVAASFSAGIILHVFKENIFKGFLIIFGLAAIFRFISWIYLTRMYEPKIEYKKENYFNFFQFLSRVKNSNFTSFVFFVAGLNLCVNIAAPFFSVFMLRDLKFNYITYTILTITVTVTILLLISRWGVISDKIGNIRVLKFTSFFIASLPIFWIISQNVIYLMLIQVLGGFAWSGFNLCASNFIYDAVTPAKRTRCIAYFSAVNGLGLCFGALIGGFLGPRLPIIFGYRLLSLFMISSILRFFVAGILSRPLKEVRPVEHIGNLDLVCQVIGLKE